MNLIEILEPELEIYFVGSNLKPDSWFHFLCGTTTRTETILISSFELELEPEVQIIKVKNHIKPQLGFVELVISSCENLDDLIS